MQVAFQIAKTQMFSRLKQTIIAMLGVTFGIAMFILLVSFMTGLNILLEQTMLSATPHIRIYKDIKISEKSILDEIQNPQENINIVYHTKPKEEKSNIKNGMQIVESIRKDERILGVSPQLSTQVFFNFGSVQIGGMMVGVQIMEENKLFNLDEKIKAGKLQDILSANNGIIIGIGLAKKLNAKVGDNIYISTPKGIIKLLKIIGFFQFGAGAIDDTRAYANLNTVQKLLQKDNFYITDINIKVKQYNEAKNIAQEYAKKYNYKAEDWETANATILVSFTIRNIITYAVSVTLLVVAGFGIYNIMNMTIYEKMRDIAILKATGFAGKDVMNIFMIQSLIIGILGGLGGLLIGFLLSFWVSNIPFDTNGVLNVNTFPINFDINYYWIGIIFGVSTTALAGFLPSRKAAKIDPVKIIRG
jgi:lipoprotein-releasing system permease protein